MFDTSKISDTFSFISERGVLSGLYFGCLALGLVLGAKVAIASDTYLWIASICLLLGLIISNITYEWLLTFHRWISEPITVRTFHQTTENIFRKEILKYEHLRKFREEFLSFNNPERLKSAIISGQRLRQTLTYLSSASFLALVLLLAIRNRNVVYIDVINAELVVVIYVLIASIAGNLTRSASIGRALGHAYLYSLIAQKNSNTVVGDLSDKNQKPILCLDFDGVLHWYRQGWKEPTVIDDIPVPGAQEFVNKATKDFRVVVFSTRGNYPGGVDAIKDWLRKYKFPVVEVVTNKPVSHVILDDRSMTFNGKWPESSDLLKFRPWNRKGKNSS